MCMICSTMQRRHKHCNRITKLREKYGCFCIHMRARQGAQRWQATGQRKVLLRLNPTTQQEL